MSNILWKIKRFLYMLANLILYHRWTDCQHDWHPEGFADWKCGRCGVWR